MHNPIHPTKQPKQYYSIELIDEEQLICAECLKVIDRNSTAWLLVDPNLQNSCSICDVYCTSCKED